MESRGLITVGCFFSVGAWFAALVLDGSVGFAFGASILTGWQAVTVALHK